MIIFFSYLGKKAFAIYLKDTESKVSFLLNTQRHSYRLEAPVPSRMGPGGSLPFLKFLMTARERLRPRGEMKAIRCLPAQTRYLIMLNEGR